MLFQDSYEQEHLLNEFTSKFHMERSKAEEVCNINVIAMELQIELQILDFLRNGHQCGEVGEANTGNEASLTWLDVKPVNRQVSNPTFLAIFKLSELIKKHFLQIASNLANFGNPFGGPNLQNRAGAKSKENNAKKNEDSVWFGN